MPEDNVFVKIEAFKDVSDVLKLTHEKLSQAKALFQKIQELKSREDEQLAAWARKLEDVESRVQNVDQSIHRNA